MMKVVEIDAKPFSCTKCSTRFKTKRNIKRHMQEQHSENPTRHQCWFCKRIYLNKANYNEHWQKTHKHEHLLYLEPEKVTIVGK